MVAGIEFATFPEIRIGPITLFTFGLFVAAGVLLGVTAAARYAEARGVHKDRVYRLAVWLVVLGVIGARLAWVLTHLDQIDSPLDVIAVWEGGLTFTGSFLVAGIVAYATLRRWTPAERWTVADGAGLGLAWGIAVGRIGCIAVGEHLGEPTSFFLGWTYAGGPTREGPLTVGVTYHNTALYEALLMLALGIALWWLLCRVRPSPGVGFGVFCVAYGAARFVTDFFRAYDRTALGLTAAQYLCVALFALGVLILARTGSRARRLGDDPPVAPEGVEVPS